MLCLPGPFLSCPHTKERKGSGYVRLAMTVLIIIVLHDVKGTTIVVHDTLVNVKVYKASSRSSVTKLQHNKF